MIPTSVCCFLEPVAAFHTVRLRDSRPLGLAVHRVRLSPIWHQSGLGTVAALCDVMFEWKRYFGGVCGVGRGGAKRVVSSAAAIVTICAVTACGNSDETHLYAGVTFTVSPEGLLAPGTSALATFSYKETLTTCRDEGGSLEGHIECTSESTTIPAEIVSATCDAAGCTATSTSASELSITSDREGSVVVVVVVQGPGTTNQFTKQLVVHFSNATRFDVYHDGVTSLGATLPVIKGTKLRWCATAYG